MTQSYCLDTNVLLLLLRGGDRGRQIDRSYGLSQAFNQHVVSIVSHGELYALGDANGWGANKFAALSNMLHQLVTVDVSGDRIVAAYRQVEQENRPEGAPHYVMGKNDIWIAATAIVTKLPLLTTDGDFTHLHSKLLTVYTIQ